ncbi:hypothetical protein QBZ16_000552 [Prototheca wickerhamii]|uniref:Uncharacterized protein n=1 Tax=Prototheca wickerhamii TaxID=3111 RepID=A0AAD9IMZ9_PROWI|nr:hypothetical protein QBZ16_000552 [Prototheca wickerhamii]
MPGSSDHDKYAAGYAAIAVASAAMAIPLIFQPRSTAEFLLGASALPTNMEQDRLMGLVAAGLLSAGATAWALKSDAEKHELDVGASETLQLGLIGFAATNLAAHLAHVNDLTPNGLAAGVATAAVSAAVPAARLLLSPAGRRKIVDRLRDAVDSVCRRSLDFGNRGRGFRFTSALYALMGADSVYLWRQIGTAMLTIAPAALLALKDRADNDELGEAQPRALNAGLLLAGTAQLAVLAPMAADGAGGRYLPLVLGLSGATALAGVLGLASSNGRRL